MKSFLHVQEVESTVSPPLNPAKTGEIVFHELIAKMHRLTGKLPPPLAEVEGGGEHISLDELLRDSSGELIGNLDYTSSPEELRNEQPTVSEAGPSSVPEASTPRIKPAFPELLRSIYEPAGPTVGVNQDAEFEPSSSLLSIDNEIDIDGPGKVVARKKKTVVASLRLEESERPAIPVDEVTAEATKNHQDDDDFSDADEGDADVDNRKRFSTDIFCLLY